MKSNYSLIYKTVVSIFKILKFDFEKNYQKRNLVIVSDMMQHSDRMSSYNSAERKIQKSRIHARHLIS